ncbi:MAG: carbamoyl phosphate synthase small subunit [Oscillospiraceae bacterium]
MKAYLMLEDGSIYDGIARGDFRETPCEVVFNTSMTGYVEILTDPSYAGQGIVMTYPMIGNYGVSVEDFESMKLQPCAFIVHELCTTPSNFRNTMPLEDLMIKFHIPCVSGIDTRAVVKKLRESGAMRGVITDDISDKERLMKIIKDFHHEGLVESVTLPQKRILGAENTGAKIALLDFGTKRNIANSLVKRGCIVTEYPSFTTADEIIKSSPDGIMLSNGPGDPSDCVNIIKEIKKLYDFSIPTFAICLGHQLMALANGGETEKMKYGHRGANHPVKFLNEDKTYLSSQNHGYMVNGKGLPSNAEINCINVNDKTVEGIVYHQKPVFTVQFHPEANAGPRDTAFLFDRFLKMVAKGKYDD